MSVKCGVALLLLACFAGFFAVSSAQDDRCEQGWRYYDDSCYFREKKNKKTWQDAQSYCETMQADLTTVNNEDEMKFLKSILGKFESWCGLNNREFVWQSGEQSNYTNWSQGQPKWYCAYIMSRKQAYKWQTAKCSAKYRYTCEKVAPCPSKPCKNGGTCIKDGDSYRCQCPVLFTGPQCETETVVDPCDSSPCMNGGTCNSTGDVFSCACTDQYTGDSCETQVDPCDSSPCMNGGTCNSTGDQFSCSCTGQFTGDKCETLPSCSNSIKAVGNPVTHVLRSYTQGAWMKDPTVVMGTETIFVMPSYRDINAVEEYENLEKLKAGEARKTYQLPYSWDGTGAVVYGQYLYYNRDNTRYIVKYNLHSESVEAELELSSYVPWKVGYGWAGGSGVDLAVDEQGLWVLWGVVENDSRLTLGKIDVDKFVITQTWPLDTESMSWMGNAFVACGVVYCIDEWGSSPTTINFAYDTKTDKQWNPNIQFINPYEYNSMVDYNPREKVLYSWDNQRLVTYSLTFE